MSNKHVIELNGNKYNALTGQIITQTTGQTARPAHTVSAPTSQPFRRLDGVARPKRPVTTATTATHGSKVHRKADRSHTLMRTAVKKPAPQQAIHSVVGRSARTAAGVKKSPQIISAVSPDTLDPHRIARATHTPKSGLVSKFGSSKKHAVVLTEVPVHAPEQQHHANAHTQHHAPRLATPANPFEAAIQHATSHEQPKSKVPRLHHRIARKLHVQPRTLIYGVAGLVLLTIGGFVAYTRVPSVAMKVAATKAGIHANLPAYQPAGFSLKGPINTAPGEISVNYQSNSDNRDFKVVQKSSSWNSKTLLDNFVAATKEASYQTFQSGGRTIYIYDGGNATWVDGGIWYKIEGNSSLNSDQLLRIANSL